MKKILTLAVLCTLLFHSNVQSQVAGPPSLAVGAAGVLYSKGTLDPNAIIDVISSKRDEVKKEVAKRLLMKRFYNGSFTLYTFAKNNLDVLLAENNPDIIKKELLENSTELALVYAFSEIYLRTEWFLYSDPSVKRKAAFWALLNDTSIKSSGSIINKNNFQKWNSIAGDHFFLLSSLRSDSNYHKPGDWISRKEDAWTSLNNVFIDLVFDVLRKNEEVMKAGFFARNYKLNEALDIRPDCYKNFIQKHPKLKSKMDSLKKDINDKASTIFGFYHTLVGKMGPNSNNNLLQYNKSGGTASTAPTASILLSELKNLSGTQANLLLSPEEKAIVENVWQALQPSSLQQAALDNGKTWEDLAYLLQDKFIPMLVKRGLEGKDSQTLINASANLADNILDYRLTKLPENGFKVSKDVIRLLKSIQELNKVETYEFIFKFITVLAQQYGDPSVRKTFEYITAASDRYLVFNGENNRVDIDVQSMAVDLFKRFGDEQGSRVSLYFSVGVNYGLPTNSQSFINLINPNKSPTDSAAQRSSLAFVSEKIGLKFKILDFSRRWGYYVSTQKVNGVGAFRNAKPIVNDIHAIAFGSGLLYNIATLNSSPSFKDPLVGFGIGATFFNGLDLNLTANWITSQKLSLGLWTVSLDFKFVEYLASLSKRQGAGKSNGN